tara:strand:+ start:252 stop:407 length:156 start_codon:yes stop_codon:yes gene_type:complete
MMYEDKDKSKKKPSKMRGRTSKRKKKVLERINKMLDLMTSHKIQAPTKNNK